MLGVGSRGESCAPCSEFFLNFYVKLMSSGALWVAISYRLRLAACFTRIGSTCGIEIYWRSYVPAFFAPITVLQSV